jgi:hypothetical protein
MKIYNNKITVWIGYKKLQIQIQVKIQVKIQFKR